MRELGFVGFLPAGKVTVVERTQRRLCSRCVLEPYLSAEIEKHGRRDNCFYCEDKGETFSIEQIATAVSSILADFYHLAGPTEGKPIDTVIDDLVGVSEIVVEDIRSVLTYRSTPEWNGVMPGSGSFDPDSRYAKDDSVNTWDFESKWFDFEKKLKTETRYFNRDAELWLASLFEGIDVYRTIFGRPIIVDAGPGTSFAKLYRARVSKSEAEIRDAMKRPDVKIGPPPSEKAVAGRMNAAGISVFYGATESAVALAEIRPPVGSKALVACFELIRPLKLLDLVAMNDISNRTGSLFDDGYQHHLKQTQFLRGLGWRLSKPVLPDDQTLDYLPTQAVADFLATEATPNLDGIIYPSVQVGHHTRRNYGVFSSHVGYRSNVVLFQKAARGQCLDTGTRITVSDKSFLSSLALDCLDDSPDVEYVVRVADAEDSRSPGDGDEVSLKFSSLEVHYVTAVKFDTRHSTIPRLLGEQTPDSEG